MIGILFGALLLAAQPRVPVERVPGWTSNGPEGGSVFALATGSDGAVYAGTDGGLFRSADGDLPWTRLDFPAEGNPVEGNFTVTWIGVAPSDPTVVYAAETAPLRIYDHVIEMYRSDDGGTTWSARIAYIEDDFITKFNVAFDPTDALTLYLSINCCSSKSTDGGTTWMGLTPSMTSIAVDPSSPSTLYGNADVEDQPGHAVNHLQKSIDAGASWTPTDLVTENEFLLVDPDDPSVLYASGTFARSDDGGLSISTQTTSPGPVYSLAFGGGTPRRLYARVLEGSDIVVYTSEDRGATWSLAGAPPGGLASLAVGPVSEQQDRLFGGSSGDRGAFVSTDGGADWESRIDGLDAASIGAIAVLPADGRFAYALGPGFAKTSDGGITWSADPYAPVASSGGLAVDPTNPNVIYAADTTAGLRRSSDAGATWSAASPTGQFVTSIAVDPLQSAIVYAADGRPLKSIDGGSTWQVVDAGIPDGVTRVAVDPADPSIVYAIGPGLYRSRDAGATWNLTLEGHFDAIAPDPGHPGVVYASSGPFAWRSGDFGSSWSQVSTQQAVDLIDLVCDASGVVYAAGRSAIPQLLGLTTPLRSDDGGATWSSIGGWGQFAPSFPFLIRALAVDLAGRNLYAGTEQGVWELERAPRRIQRP